MSRSRALMIAGSASLLALGAVSAFGLWAATSWRAAGERIDAAADAISIAEARATQAELYGPLQAAWVEYAGTDISGLVRAPTGEDGLTALVERLEATFAEAGAVAIRVAPLRVASTESHDATPRSDGVAIRAESLVLEARAQAPEARLVALLAALETQTPFVFVEELELRPIGAPTGATTPERWVSLRARVSALRAAEVVQ